MKLAFMYDLIGATNSAQTHQYMPYRHDSKIRNRAKQCYNRLVTSQWQKLILVCGVIMRYIKARQLCPHKRLPLQKYLWSWQRWVVSHDWSRPPLITSLIENKKNKHDKWKTYSLGSWEQQIVWSVRHLKQGLPEDSDAAVQLYLMLGRSTALRNWHKPTHLV